MKIAICKTWTFEAAHHLPHLPDGHQCKRRHGHSYKLEVELLAEAVAHGPYQGMVVDYDQMDGAIRPLLDMVDHRELNEVRGLENPTTEVLVRWMAEKLANIFDGDVERVRVYESNTTWAEVRGGVTMRGVADAVARRTAEIDKRRTQAQIEAEARVASVHAALNALRATCRDAVERYDNGRHRVARDMVAEAVGLPIDQVVVHDDILDIERHMQQAAQDLVDELERGDAIDQHSQVSQKLISTLKALVAAYKRR